MNKTVLYIGRFGNENTAAFMRAENIAKQIVCNHCRVIIASHNTGLIKIYGREIKTEHICNIKITRWNSITQYYTGQVAFDFFIKCMKKYQVNAVILYNETYAFSKKVLNYSKKYNLEVYSDVTEWYEFSSIKNLASFAFTRCVDKRIRKLDSQMKGIIVISDFLYQHYKSKAVSVIKVPPLMVLENNLDTVKFSMPIKLIYAGSPGTKDLLVPIFEAIEKINKELPRVVFDLYGLTDNEVKYIWKEADLQELGIICHGKVNHDVVVNAVRKAHFSILLRKKQRYAVAGYSTKVSESLYCGTPVICNRIGGTDRDILDSINGFVVEDYSGECIKELLCNIIYMDEELYAKMRANAQKRAKEMYSGAKYANELRRFFGI